MISKTLKYKHFCKDNRYDLVENYEEAVSSNEEYVCHHRFEINGLGEEIPAKALIALKMYYNVPPEELIFMTRTDHQKMHNAARGPETNKKISKKLKGKPLSPETVKKLSEAHKGQVPWSKGKKFSEEHRKKLSESHMGQIPWNKKSR